MEILKIFIAPMLTSFVITYFAIPKIIQFAKNSRLYAAKAGRHSHKGKVPIFGGAGIFVGILMSLLIWRTLLWIENEDVSIIVQDLKIGLAIIFSIIIIFFTGLIDDLLSLTPIKKLISQIVAVLILIFLGGLEIKSMMGVLGIQALPMWLSIFFTIFVVIVITNAYNLIDGIDGLAGGLGVISSAFFGFLFFLNQDYGFTILSFAVIGSLLAFLRFNFNPASIFMGDTGSLVVGMILSIFAIRLINEGVALPFGDDLINESRFGKRGPFMAIAILAVPLYDTFRIFIIRSLSGYNPLHADRNHIHHALLDLGFGHRTSSIILWIFSIVIICISYQLIQYEHSLAIFALSAFVLSCMSFPFILLRIRETRK
tara:strand:+ start:535 stop:1647 length:1113 start_codon:yes stop_codon:yes gene_type:complete